MKNLKIFFGLTLMVMFVMTSCSKENIVDNSLLDQSSVSANKTDSKEDALKTIFVLAKNLSIAVEKDNSILPDLEERCNISNENGHYEKEFFFHLDKDISLGKVGDNNLNKILKSTDKNYKSLGNACDAPGLSILLEGNLESEKYSNRIYLDDGFDDSDPNAHIKYYENGVMNSHSISEVPDAKAFVVRICENFISKSDPFYETQRKFEATTIEKIGYTECGEEINIIQTLDVLTDMQIKDSDVTNYKSGTCERDMNGNKTENLSLFSTTDIHEGWRGKHGEFKFYAIWATDVQYQFVNGGLQVTGNPLSSSTSGKFSIKKNELAQINYSTVIWDTDTDADRMKYVIYEDDGGSTKVINIDLSASYEPPSVPGLSASISTSIPITINNGDDKVAEQIVDYCQNVGLACCSNVIQGSAYTTDDGGTFSSSNYLCCINDIGRQYTPGGGVTFYINND